MQAVGQGLDILQKRVKGRLKVEGIEKAKMRPGVLQGASQKRDRN